MKRKNKCASKKAYPTTDVCLKKIRLAYKKRKVKLRFYECPVCLDFHLTHTGSKAELDIYNKMWRKEGQLNNLKQQVAKQYRQFEQLFNQEWKKVYDKKTPKKPKTTLRGTLPLAKQREILATLDNLKFSTPNTFWTRFFGIIDR